MIEVKLEDFENYRGELLRYATGLLLSRGSGNTKTKELTPKAEDIVQETYFDFHRHHKDAFVNEKHLESFIKMCLYRNYQVSIRPTYRVNQYNILKEGQIEFLEDEKHPLGLDDYDNKDVLSIFKGDEFRKTLTTNQILILNTLLNGWTQSEISKELGITRQGVSNVVKNIKIKYSKFIE